MEPNVCRFDSNRNTASSQLGFGCNIGDCSRWTEWTGDLHAQAGVGASKRGGWRNEGQEFAAIKQLRLPNLQQEQERKRNMYEPLFRRGIILPLGLQHCYWCAAVNDCNYDVHFVRSLRRGTECHSQPVLKARSLRTNIGFILRGAATSVQFATQLELVILMRLTLAALSERV